MLDAKCSELCSIAAANVALQAGQRQANYGLSKCNGRTLTLVLAARFIAEGKPLAKRPKEDSRS